jgi:N utilization substance protein A
LASIYQSIEILGKEKGIDPQIILDAVKDAMLVAARKHFKVADDLLAEFDAKGGLQIYKVRTVAEAVEDKNTQILLEDAHRIDPNVEVGGLVRLGSLPTDVLGRIAAQTAKQVILQKVREAERDTVFKAFAGRDGELVQCTVKRIEGMDIVVEIDREKIEARLPKREQARTDSFQTGDRVKCVIRGVERTGKNSGVVVSRSAPELVMRLFEQEVPEIYDNTVQIRACSREAGERTKIAVFSRDRDVDSVGACVGMKGMRVQSIIRELRNEKIDIIEYSDDPVTFATNALSPAKITRVVVLDPVDRHMEVIVDDSQLSLAIGKKGQNVRLAAKLLGWKIDIKSEEEKRQEMESQMAAFQVSGTPIAVLIDHGVSEAAVDKLIAAGINTLERLGEMTAEELAATEGVGPEESDAIIAAINSYYGQGDGAAPGEEEAPVESGPEATEPAEPELAETEPPKTESEDAKPDTEDGASAVAVAAEGEDGSAAESAPSQADTEPPAGEPESEPEPEAEVPVEERAAEAESVAPASDAGNS